MMDFLAQLIAWINVPMNALSRSLLGFIGIMPDFIPLSITVKRHHMYEQFSRETRYLF